LLDQTPLAAAQGKGDFLFNAAAAHFIGLGVNLVLFWPEGFQLDN